MPQHPPKPARGPLHDYWDKEVHKLVLLDTPEMEPGLQERHTLYSLLTMALIHHYWNGNKRGQQGSYPHWREKQKRHDGLGYMGGDYLGHNIACIAVDGRGEVIDFDFNHNDLLNSSVEHAESRLIRRVFSLSQIYDNWATVDKELAPTPYSTLLSDVTVYTSLESCSQCSGIMALGSVKEVIFLHRDPSQHSIGNILRNLGPEGGRYRPPLPIPADAFGLAQFKGLSQGYEYFANGLAKQDPTMAFHVDAQGKKDSEPSITSFLCTDLAYEQFELGRRQLDDMKTCECPEYQPKVANACPLTNEEVLVHVRRFLKYATIRGHRGTPHKL